MRILQTRIPISGGETHLQIPILYSVLSMEALEGALNKEKVLPKAPSPYSVNINVHRQLENYKLLILGS